jgi:hypothetical protein
MCNTCRNKHSSRKTLGFISPIDYLISKEAMSKKIATYTRS